VTNLHMAGWGVRRNSVTLLQDSQASPARHSGRSKHTVRTSPRIQDVSIRKTS